ncbi:hypothetical protein HS088_TW07G00836 [Tripterygium wilfordii]|uniref:Uncharacterized protein n=1 Tax=Tripterygium wilfordii TaxID=458696 RepID=A0A7J7DG19_TRIWF|nr:uncharacterized protein LOC120001448 [Tripterygium wilfordii]KAF5745253.1 hypothetical protein HS088_TW07G00836 [Tripterygium wilfordii]
MAIDVCSEISSAGISPRISFSHDLNQTSDAASAERRLDLSLLDSDFDFCIGGTNFVQELSSADELFSNGKILPIEIKKSKEITPNQPDHSTPLIPTIETTTAEKKRLKEFLSANPDEDERPQSKSFWQFNRSTSLKCDSTRNKSLIRSLSFLSRSNSTGSVPNPKQTTVSKDSQRPQFQRQKSAPSRRQSSSSVSSSGTFYSYNSKKNTGSYNGNGIKISPVLNLPPPDTCIGTMTSLFGLGSLFCSGKVKKKKRWI